ncbi:MAG: dockerin type I repeat-containing protein [Ruminococcus sp.]|nr:dockerin type I repeat-containing protein [Ruminococcus sp.]
MKKLTKKALSGIVAVSCMLSGSATNSYAIFTLGTLNEINNYLPGCKEFDDSGIFSNIIYHKYGYRTFYNDDMIATASYYPAYFYFEVPSDVSIKVERLLFDSSDSTWSWNGQLNDKTNIKSYYVLMGEPTAEKSKIAKDLFNVINDKYDVSCFKFCGNPISYSFFTFDKNENIIDGIQKFINEYGQFSADGISEMTMDEYMTAVKQIEDETGHYLRISCNDSAEKQEDTIDILNSIESDANEDGEVSIADAAAIVKHMGNPDLYALTPQGYFNADIDGDGLTGADAIEIQYKIIKAGMPQ